MTAVSLPSNSLACEYEDLEQAKLCIHAASPQADDTPTSAGDCTASPSSYFDPFADNLHFGQSLRADASCLLVDCGPVCPTCDSIPDEPKLEHAEFQRRAVGLVEEFLLGRDVRGTVASVEALGCAPFLDELVALMIRASLDRGEVERQGVMALLGALAIEEIVSDAQLARGFQKVVLAWEDLRLDVPDVAAHIAALVSFSFSFLDRSWLMRLPTALLRALKPGALKEELEVNLQEAETFATQLATHLEGFFQSRSADELISWLRAADKPGLHHEVVFIACMSSLDDAPSPSSFWTSCFTGSGLVEEKQAMMLNLLERLHSEQEGRLISEADLQLGFSKLLGAAGSITSGRPDAPELFAALLAGAVSRQLLPAEFLRCARRLRFGSHSGVAAVRLALRRTPLFSRRVWGSGDAKHFRQELQDGILEYLDCHDVEELALIIQELHLSGRQQETFLRDLLAASVERGGRAPGVALDAVADLMDLCWTREAVLGAFEELHEGATDWALDFPACREHMADLGRLASRRGLLDAPHHGFDASDRV